MQCRNGLKNETDVYSRYKTMQKKRTVGVGDVSDGEGNEEAVNDPLEERNQNPKSRRGNRNKRGKREKTECEWKACDIVVIRHSNTSLQHRTTRQDISQRKPNGKPKLHHITSPHKKTKG